MTAANRYPLHDQFDHYEADLLTDFLDWLVEWHYLTSEQAAAEPYPSSLLLQFLGIDVAAFRAEQAALAAEEAVVIGSDRRQEP